MIYINSQKNNDIKKITFYVYGKENIDLLNKFETKLKIRNADLNKYEKLTRSAVISELFLKFIKKEIVIENEETIIKVLNPIIKKSLREGLKDLFLIFNNNNVQIDDKLDLIIKLLVGNLKVSYHAINNMFDRKEVETQLTNPNSALYELPKWIKNEIINEDNLLNSND